MDGGALTTAAAAEHVDVAIVGGGPIGLALALALDGSGLAVALLEAGTRFERGDPRAIALAQGSRLILERLGVWPTLAMHATPIETIHVSQRGTPGRTVLTAREAGVPALGYTVEYGQLHRALAQGLHAQAALVLTGARVGVVRPAAGCGLIEYDQAGQTRQLSARLIVLADGGGLPARGTVLAKDYGVSAIVCTVSTHLPHAHTAYERFTPQGPIALLPLGEAYALVWTTPAAEVERRLGLAEQDFLAELQTAFGERQGRFLAASPRAAFPLRLRQVGERPRPGLVRVGNAAQTLHPVAGQGFNLGLRDAWQLARLAAETPRSALGGADFLARYGALRRWDVAGGLVMTDVLAELFTGADPLAGAVRGAALTLLDTLPPLKRTLARKMMFGAAAW
ncbi:MAG: FAD-dependent monooxygenase [Thiobacillaceae bacterium]|nr:FAD-dependent monooxygenase [Thiobacillaceae bacterium]